MEGITSENEPRQLSHPFCSVVRSSMTYVISKVHELFILNWVQVSFLTQMSAHPVVCVVMHLTRKPVLGLQVLRKRIPLNQWSVLPLHLPLEPLLPSLVGVDHWVHQLLLLLLQEVGHLIWLLIEDYPFEKLGVVYIPISILFSVFLIILRVLNGLPLLGLKVLEKHPCDFIVPSKNGIINDPEAQGGGVIDVGPRNNQNLCNLQTISFDSDSQGGLSLGSGRIGVSLEGEKQVDNLNIAVKDSPHEPSLLGILDNRIIDNFRMLFKKSSNIGHIFPLNVVVQQLLL